MIEALKLGFPVAAAQHLLGTKTWKCPLALRFSPEVCGPNCWKHGDFPARDAVWFCGPGIVACNLQPNLRQ